MTWIVFSLVFMAGVGTGGLCALLALSAATTRRQRKIAEDLTEIIAADRLFDENRRLDTMFDAIFDGWDDIRPTDECLHCGGTGSAPSSDGKTDCGFCTEDGWEIWS